MQLAIVIVAAALLALGFLEEDAGPMLAGTLLFVLSADARIDHHVRIGHLTQHHRLGGMLPGPPWQ